MLGERPASLDLTALPADQRHIAQAFIEGGALSRSMARPLGEVLPGATDVSVLVAMAAHGMVQEGEAGYFYFEHSARFADRRDVFDSVLTVAVSIALLVVLAAVIAIATR